MDDQLTIAEQKIKKALYHVTVPLKLRLFSDMPLSTPLIQEFYWRNTRKALAYLEPPCGFEPQTYALRVRCSTN